MERSPPWIESVATGLGSSKHQGASSSATQEQVGEWLGLIDVVEKTEKGKQVLSESELNLISCALGHTIILNDAQVFIPGQLQEQAQNWLNLLEQPRNVPIKKGCHCLLHSTLDTIPEGGNLRELLRELLAFTSENSGEFFSGNCGNIAVI